MRTSSASQRAFSSALTMGRCGGSGFIGAPLPRCALKNTRSTSPFLSSVTKREPSFATSTSTGAPSGILAVGALLPATDDVHRLAGARNALRVDGHEHEAVAVVAIAVERDDQLVLVRRREHAAGVERHAERRDVSGQQQRRVLVMRAVYTTAILGVWRAVVDAVGPAVVGALSDDVELLVRDTRRRGPSPSRPSRRRRGHRCRAARCRARR